MLVFVDRLVDAGITMWHDKTTSGWQKAKAIKEGAQQHTRLKTRKILRKEMDDQYAYRNMSSKLYALERHGKRSRQERLKV